MREEEDALRHQGGGKKTKIKTADERCGWGGEETKQGKRNRLTR